MKNVTLIAMFTLLLKTKKITLKGVNFFINKGKF